MYAVKRWSSRLVSLPAGFLGLFAAAAVQAAMPLEGVFVENLGQWPEQARFHMLVGETGGERSRKVDVWLTSGGYVYQATERPVDPGAAGRQHVVAVELVGAGEAQTRGYEPMPGVFNWLGANEAQTVRGARSYRQVRYGQVYPGIDLVFDSATETRMLETTFVVAPGVSPDPIALRYRGADATRIDAGGNLVLSTTLGEITEMSPIAFQLRDNGSRETVPVKFRLDGDRLAFDLGAYDASRTLYIDPIVTFSRGLGGTSADYISEMHENASGRYVTGFTTSSDFPTTVGAHDRVYDGGDLFAAKFDAANANLLWATFIGGTSTESGGNSALASDGSLYLVASTQSGASWPAFFTWGPGGGYDVGVFRLSADGTTQLGGIRLGGSGSDYAADVEIDGAGNVVFSGAAGNSTFPTGPGGYDVTHDGGLDAFVARFDNTLTAWIDFSYVPGSSSSDGAGGHAFDAAGNVYVHGFTIAANDYNATDVIGPGGNYDLFVARFNSDLSALDYNTRIGGQSTDPTPGYSYTSAQFYTIANSALLVDSANRAWVTGAAASTDFPTTPDAFSTTNAGNYDVFVLALNAAGDGLVASTFIGGSSTDVGRALAIDAAGNVYVAGSTASNNFPVQDSPQEHAGNYDLFLTVLSPGLSEVLSSSLWGSGSTELASDLVLGSGTRVRVAGHSHGAAAMQLPSDAPLFGPGGSSDGVVVEFSDVQVVIGTARFRVVKRFTDPSEDEVEVTLTCNSGIPLQQSFTIAGGDPDGVTFVVTDIPEGGADCEVTESGGPANYTATFNGSEDGCRWTDIRWGLRSCEIVNTPDPATYTVVKDWEVPEDQGFEEIDYDVDVAIWCASDILKVGTTTWGGSYWSGTLSGDGSTVTVEVDTTGGQTSCWAEEAFTQSGVEDSASEACGYETRAMLEAGGSATCTFTNTVFFEGIPALGRSGLVLLALLMLGVGFIGMRRIT